VEREPAAAGVAANARGVCCPEAAAAAETAATFCGVAGADDDAGSDTTRWRTMKGSSTVHTLRPRGQNWDLVPSRSTAPLCNAGDKPARPHWRSSLWALQKVWVVERADVLGCVRARAGAPAR
jgi:hypothetical protein